MAIYNSFIICFLIYYTFFFSSLFRYNKRKSIQYVNNELDKKRKIAVKTLDEQKEFLTLKNGTYQKFKFSWKFLFNTIYYIFIGILLFILYSYILKILNYNFKLWQVLTLFMLGPIVINWILKKFHLEQTDLGVILKWKD